jgi:hypothetical protein
MTADVTPQVHIGTPTLPDAQLAHRIARTWRCHCGHVVIQPYVPTHADPAEHAVAAAKALRTASQAHAEECGR